MNLNENLANSAELTLFYHPQSSGKVERMSGVTKPSQPLTQEMNRKARALLPPTLSQGIPRGMYKSKPQLLTGFVNTVAEQTQINSLREKPIA